MTPPKSDYLRSESFLDSCTLVLDQHEEKEFHGSQGNTH